MWRWVVSSTPRPLYARGKRTRYPMDRRLSWPQSRSGRGNAVARHINNSWRISACLVLGDFTDTQILNARVQIHSYLPVFSFRDYVFSYTRFSFLEPSPISKTRFLTKLQETGVRVPAGAENFSLHHRVQTGSGANPASYPMGNRELFPWR
jgi:hypothetical protein